MSKAMKRALIVCSLLVAAGLGGAAAVQAGGEEDAVTGLRAEAPTAAALQITGGGTANSVELDDENGATWEVEVTKPDGVTVDVRLDAAYRLVVVEGDSDVR